MICHPDNDELQTAYEQEVHDLLYRRTRIGYVLVLILVPAGGVLDYFVYADSGLLWPILYARAICTGFLIPLFALTLSAVGPHHARILNIALVVAPVFAMCWMIHVTTGAASSYYAGLNLMIVGACLLAPYTGRGGAAYCFVVVVSYVAACVLHRKQPMITSILFNNLFFIVLTSVICVTACHYSTLARLADFRLRHVLDTRNKELRHSNTRLAEMDRLKSQFFANVNHELRTPLTLILSPIEMLLHREPPLPEKVGHFLLMVKNNGLRLLKLINDMLEVLRLEEGGSSIQRKPINLVTWMGGIVDSMKYLATTKKIEMIFDQPSGSINIRADPSRLEKVMLNLLTNAIKFTNPNGVITTRLWQKGDDAAVIEVQDTGIGIAQEELPYVFDRFRQADGSSTRKYQGVGLGLALTKELIKEHHGKLAVQSRIGEGTTFTIELPIDHTAGAKDVQSVSPHHEHEDPFAETFSAADRAGPLARSIEEQDLREVGTGPDRLLIVDDEPDMRRFLVTILSDDYRIQQAADGITGLEMARREQPDLMLLDLMLPGMDGLDVCRELKKYEQTRDIKIILLTARVDEGSKIEALERGADDFLTKPFSTAEVKTRLSNLLRTARLQKDLRVQNRELDQALKSLKTTEAHLIQSEKMNALGSLASGLLHEINNPLNYTMTAVQVLQQNAQADDDLKDTLSDIDEGMQRIRDIVSELRTFAYPESADHREAFRLSEALGTALRFTSHLRNGHQVEQHLSPDSVIVGSKTHMSQVFVNLLSNSLHAIDAVHDKRPGRLCVESQRHGDALRIRVWDNGVGIDPTVLPRVFDPFFTTRQVGDGVGLGLSVCHTIVKNHGGTIRVESEKDCYTQVTIELPLARQG